jgi:hypothetical protein
VFENGNEDRWRGEVLRVLSKEFQGRTLSGWGCGHLLRAVQNRTDSRPHQRETDSPAAHSVASRVAGSQSIDWPHAEPPTGAFHLNGPAICGHGGSIVHSMRPMDPRQVLNRLLGQVGEFPPSQQVERLLQFVTEDAKKWDNHTLDALRIHFAGCGTAEATTLARVLEDEIARRKSSSAS